MILAIKRSVLEMFKKIKICPQIEAPQLLSKWAPQYSPLFCYRENLNTKLVKIGDIYLFLFEHTVITPIY